MEFDFGRSAPDVARDLISWQLLADTDGTTTGGVIIETEAYTSDDPASHSYSGRTLRNRAMYHAPGTLYIYLIYGMHRCLNFVCGDHDGQAVLVRALQPTVGIEAMQRRRSTVKPDQLCNGPAKLVQALGISPELNEQHFDRSPLKLLPPTKYYQVQTSSRIGISKTADTPWRFFTPDHM